LVDDGVVWWPRELRCAGEQADVSVRCGPQGYGVALRVGAAGLPGFDAGLNAANEDVECFCSGHAVDRLRRQGCGLWAVKAEQQPLIRNGRSTLR
jgi:hypothetical protein